MMHPTFAAKCGNYDNTKELEDIISEGDLKGLCDAIQGIAFHTVQDGKIWPHIMMARNWCRLIHTAQRNGDINNHSRNYEAQYDALELLWGSTIPHKLVGNKSTENQQKARKRFQVALFLESVEQRKCKHVLDSLHADYLNNHNNYKDTVEDVITVLQQRRDVAGNHRSENSFAQCEDKVDMDGMSDACEKDENQHQQIEEVEFDTDVDSVSSANRASNTSRGSTDRVSVWEARPALSYSWIQFSQYFLNEWIVNNPQTITCNTTTHFHFSVYFGIVPLFSNAFQQECVGAMPVPWILHLSLNKCLKCEKIKFVEQDTE